MGNRKRMKKDINNVTDINSVKKKKSKTPKHINLSHIIIAMIFLYFAVIFVKQEVVIRDLKKQKQVEMKHLKDLKTEIADLKQKINKSDTVEYIEKIAREELDMIKPHEIIYKDKNKQKSDDI